MDADSLIIGSPLYLLESNDKCWKCKALQSVVALAASRLQEFDGEEDFQELPVDGLVVLYNLREMPREILEAIIRFHPQYQKRYSKTAGIYYYMNTCSCGAHFGDFFLHGDSASTFSPTNEFEAGAITLRTLPLEGEFNVNGSYTIGVGELILEFAKKADMEVEKELVDEPPKIKKTGWIKKLFS